MIAIRAAGPGDRAVIVDSWLKSYLNGDKRAATMGPGAWAKAIEQHLDAADLVLVATRTPEPHEDAGAGGAPLVVAWLVRLAPDVLGFGYTLHLWRRRGLFDRLLAAAGFDVRNRPWVYAFWTPKLQKLCSWSPAKRDRLPWKGEQIDGARARRILAGRGEAGEAGSKPAARR